MTDTQASLRAKRPRTLDISSRADQVLWELSGPVPYGRDGQAGVTRYIVTSATVVPPTGAETFMFAASRDGEIIHWAEMDGSIRGELDHEAVIKEAGWEIANDE